MKIKWLVILFIFFLIVIFLSIWITQQVQNSVPFLEKKDLIANQTGNKNLSGYSSETKPVSVMTSPLEKSGITIIKAPVAQSEEKNISVPKIADKVTNDVSGQNVISNTQGKESPSVGITKIGKRPTPKEAQEMNSSGIVLY